MRILLFIFIIFLSINSFAAVTISAVTNSSNEVDLKDTTIKIYAGISGWDPACATYAGTSVVNTCDLTASQGSCNLKTVCDKTLLQIRMSADKSGEILLVDSDDNPIDLANNSGDDYVSGQDRVVYVEWGDICNELGAGSDCSAVPTTNPQTLKLGVKASGDTELTSPLSISFGVYEIPDTDTTAHTSYADVAGEGIEDYYLKPGDEKAIIMDYSTIDSDFSITGAADIVGIRGFFIPGDCSTAIGLINTSNDSVLITIDDDKTIQNNRIEEGLTNYQPYLFMFGMQDEAGNIGLYKDLATQCLDIGTGHDHNRHSVIPLPVTGLLEENQNCYITTAAYGSPLHGKVKTFKLFRDKILNQFSLGKKLINFYYKTSPPIAETIRKNEFLKSATRIMLWPAWAISAAVLYMGLMPFLFVITMTLLSFVFLRNKKIKKKLLIIFLILSVQSAKAEDDFFSTSESATPAPKETAPKEPPYSGNEDEEFTELEDNSLKNKAEETYVPEIETPNASVSESKIPESPDKWKPYQRVPEKKRLEELSKDGLMKITKKGGYNYKVKPSEQKSAASFRFGMASFPHLENDSGLDFSEIYDTNKKPVLLVDYEWQFFKSFGKLGIKIGSGLMVASGSGQFSELVATPEEPAPGGTTDAEEKYNFYMFPNSLSAIYRLDIFNKQWLVPFGEVGIDYLTFIEARDDGDDIKFGGSPHFHFAVGGSFLLDTLGRDMMTEIDKQYGINHIWLTAEFRHLEAITSDFDFSDDIINAGIMVEY